VDDVVALRDALAFWDRLGDVSVFVALAGVILVATAQFAWRATWPRVAVFADGRQALRALGVLLVIAGLAGEMLTARRSRNISERISASLNARAGAAIENAKALEKDAAQLRLQLAKLKWRVISPEQQAMAAEWLKSAPKGPILLLHKADDEPASYAAQIRDVLRAAGFDPKLEQSQAASSLSGTFLLVKDLQRPPPHAVPLQTAFREIHVDLDGQQDQQNVPNATTVVILIGSRRL
jgi:hypothetical protein